MCASFSGAFACFIRKKTLTHDGDGVNECSDDHVANSQVDDENITDHSLLLLRCQVRADHEEVSNSSHEGKQA